MWKLLKTHVRLSELLGARCRFRIKLSHALFCSPVKRPVYLIIGSIVLAGALCLARAIVRDNQLRNGFDKIEIGATEQEVLQRLGRPKRVEKCGEFFGPPPKEEAEGCTREYFYPSPFAPLLPEYFVFRFNGNNRVTSKSPYSSP
jgi:hypothetical protein